MLRSLLVCCAQVSDFALVISNDVKWCTMFFGRWLGVSFFFCNFAALLRSLVGLWE